MLGEYLVLKCKKALEDNYKYITMMLQDPSKIVSGSVTGSLVDAAMGGMGGLQAFATTYLKNNSEALLMAAVKASGYEKTFMEAYNLAMSMLTAAIMAQNNMIFRMLKEVSWSCMKAISEKDELLIEMAENVKMLYIVLAQLVEVPSNWEEYYRNLRQALNLVVKTRTDLKVVRNTYKKQNFWLARKFNTTVTQLETARDLINPKTQNPALAKISEGSYKIQSGLKTGTPDKTQPKEDRQAQAKAKAKLINQGLGNMGKGLAYFGAGLSDNLPFPTTAEQWESMVAINQLSLKILQSMQGYFEKTMTVNTLVQAFIDGLEGLKFGFKNIMKDFVLNTFDEVLRKTDRVVESMTFTLNGRQGAMTPIVTPPPKVDANNPSHALGGAYKPNSLVVTTMSFKWISDINLILSAYKLFPTKQLEQLNLDQAAINYYKSAVAILKSMDGTRSALGSLKMTNGQEELGDLEVKMAAFLLESSNAVISGGVRREILTVARSILSRLELSLVTDDKIYNLMSGFWDMPLPMQDVLDDVYAGLETLLKNGGLDKLHSALVSGDFRKLFNLKGKDGSNVGAALSVIGLLMKCFDNQAQRDELAEMQEDLKSDADLLNITWSINFDLAIFKNLLLCLDLNRKAEKFDLAALLCDIASDLQNPTKSGFTNGKFFSKMKDLFTWDGGAG